MNTCQFWAVSYGTPNATKIMRIDRELRAFLTFRVTERLCAITLTRFARSNVQIVHVKCVHLTFRVMERLRARTFCTFKYSNVCFLDVHLQNIFKFSDPLLLMYMGVY